MEQVSTAISEKSIHLIETYIAGIFSNSKRKNCSAMAEELSISHDSVSRGLREAEKNIRHLQEGLLMIVESFIHEPGVKMVIDDTLLAKQFAQEIEGLFTNYDSSSKTYIKSLCIVVFGVSYKNIFFPLDFFVWLPHAILQDAYVKKRELAMQLIKKHRNLIGSATLLIDGLYAYQDVMRELSEMGVAFVARMHANRVVEIENIAQQIKQHASLKPSKNAQAKMQFGTWKEMALYFVCVRRKTKKADPFFVFLVSNQKKLAKEYVKLYKQRWPIEKFFRTAKQKLGLSECQSISITKQKAHIFTVFLAFARVAKKTLNSRESSTDQSINSMRRSIREAIVEKHNLIKTLVSLSKFRTA